MESLKYILLSFLLMNSSFAKDVKRKYIGLVYFVEVYGQVHSNPSKHSGAVTSIACGFPLKIYEKANVDESWAFVKAGENQGYIRKDFLSYKRPPCMQGKYPKFFQGLDLDLGELYYWGKLNDLFLREKTSAN